MRPERVVSGGQTGVDRAALDAALEAGIHARALSVLRRVFAGIC